MGSTSRSVAVSRRARSTCARVGTLEGGVAVDGVLRTEATATHVTWDRLRGDGLTLDAHGAVLSVRATEPIENGGAVLAWDADAIRGARGVLAVTQVDAAAKP